MYTNFFFLFSKAFPAMDYKTIISNKRRRKDNESSAVKYKSKEDGSNSAASASSSNTPSWAANTNKNSIIPSSNLVYGQCSNVSQRYEKLGRIGEGTYGMYAFRHQKTQIILAWLPVMTLRPRSYSLINISHRTITTAIRNKPGVVYRARDKTTKEIVALKRCLPHHEASDGFPLTTLREITLLRELQTGGTNNGIVILKDVAVSSRCVYIL